jgi:2-keto-4-pentenoate hydratase/2-oxohepta-3-ene-1,7-dioic acid hydratase in catechol pathway
VYAIVFTIISLTFSGSKLATAEEVYCCVVTDEGRNDPFLALQLKLGDGLGLFGPCLHADVDWRNRYRTLVIRDAAGFERESYTHSASGLLYPPEKIVSDLSRVQTFEPGDIIFSATTKAFIVYPGETVSTSVEGLGKLSNRILKKEREI